MAMKDTPASAPTKADRFPGRVRRTNLFWVDASQGRELAARMIPMLSRYITAMAGVAVLSMVVSLISLWARPDPLVLLSFPDGTTRCTPPPVSPRTGKAYARPKAQVIMCNDLEQSNDSALSGVDNP